MTSHHERPLIAQIQTSPVAVLALLFLRHTIAANSSVASAFEFAISLACTTCIAHSLRIRQSTEVPERHTRILIV